MNEAITIKGHQGPGQWILRVYEPALLGRHAGNGETLSAALRSLATNLERHAMEALCKEAQDVQERSNTQTFIATPCANCGSTTHHHYSIDCGGPG